MTGAFYVGYQPRAPQTVARFLRPRLAALFAVGAGIAVGAAALQPGFARSEFEYGVVREMEGVLLERPYPTLVVPEGSHWRHFLLVTEGKHGAAEAVRGLDGNVVRIRGSLARRDAGALVELHSASVVVAAAAPARPTSDTLGNATLVGEIVDGKCWLGVMNPGDGPTHRGCAERCLSGGAPPLLSVRGTDGSRLAFLLMNRAGGPLGPEVLGHTAQALRVTGLVVRRGNLLLLATEPSAWESLP